MANCSARLRYSAWISTAESSRPLARRTRRRQVMSWLISRMARIGFSSVRSRHGRESSSSMRRMIDVAPTLRNVVYSLMFESPTITCSRRKRSASAWGSSRVLMIGRERVVALDTPSQMCSARWRDAVHRAAGRLQHLARAGVDLAGDEERDQHVGELGEVAVALDEVVLVAAVGVAGGVGVVLEQVDLAADALLAEALLGAAARGPRGCAPPPCRGRRGRRSSRTRAWRTRGGCRRRGRGGRRSRGRRCSSGPTTRPGGTGSGRPRRGSAGAGRGACR